MGDSSMNRRPVQAMRHPLAMVLFALLAACSGGDRYADLRGFMTEVEGRPHGAIAPLPEFETYQAFTYGATNQRSPFMPPAIVPVKTEEQTRKTGVKPPDNHVKQYLEHFPLTALAMVGTLKTDKASFALVQDARAGVHRVRVGDYLGDQWGQIEAIEETRIKVTEIVSDGAGGWLKSPGTIELRRLQ